MRAKIFIYIFGIIVVAFVVFSFYLKSREVSKTALDSKAISSDRDVETFSSEPIHASTVIRVFDKIHNRNPTPQELKRFTDLSISEQSLIRKVRRIKSLKATPTNSNDTLHELFQEQQTIITDHIDINSPNVTGSSIDSTVESTVD